jgi:hypothetical protein
MYSAFEWHTLWETTSHLSLRAGLTKNSQEIGPAKNKVETIGVFFGLQKHAINSPRLPGVPPQFHHEITIKKHALFAAPPQKRPQNSKNSGQNRPYFFSKLAE